MNREQSIRQQVSELADGELEPPHIKALLGQLTGPAPNTVRDDWDLYHRIGDCLRSEPTAGALSADFSRRFSERLAAEPTVLAPKRDLLSGRVRGWGVALTAVAAAATGFALSPSLFHLPSVTAPASLASGPAARPADTPRAAAPVLADASNAVAQRMEPDYISLHQSANPLLYGAPALARNAAFRSDAEK